jgi:glycerol 2-dehydrogenase (NADP+)
LGSSGGELRDDPEIGAIANKHGVSPGNVLVSWSVARGIVVLPKSVTPSRIEDNIKCVSR